MSQVTPIPDTGLGLSYELGWIVWEETDKGWENPVYPSTLPYAVEVITKKLMGRALSRETIKSTKEWMKDLLTLEKRLQKTVKELTAKVTA